MKIILSIQAWLNQWNKSQKIFLLVWTAYLFGMFLAMAYLHTQEKKRTDFWRSLQNVYQGLPDGSIRVFHVNGSITTNQNQTMKTQKLKDYWQRLDKFTDTKAGHLLILVLVILLVIALAYETLK